jgi:signal transduction histidine kinase
LAEGRSAAVEDLEATDEYPVTRETGRLCGFRAVFNTPLVNLAGEVFGVLTCYFVDPHRPAGRQLDLIELYARHVGQGIANARRHEAVREADRRKDAYLKAIGHELRKPLSAMSEALRLIQSTGPDEAARAASLEVLGRETGELTRLVDHLIDLARLGSGQLALPAQPAEFAVALTQAVSGRFASPLDLDPPRPLVEPSGS